MIPEELQKAIESLALADIVLASINGEVQEGFALGVKIPEFELETLKPHPFSIQVFDPDADGSRPRRIQIRVKAGARLITKNAHGPDKNGASAAEREGTSVFAKVETDFLLTYVEKPGANLDKESLSLFAKHNVPFNVWPYWREIVHASFSRMGLPRVVLPLYRMRAMEKDKADKANARKK